MSLNLSEQDRALYLARGTIIENWKQDAILRGDVKAARKARQAMSALYKEFEAKQIYVSPTAYEIEMKMTFEERLDRIEQRLELGRYAS